MNIRDFAPALVLFLIVMPGLYIYWKHPRWMKTFNWTILTLGTAFILIGAIWKDGIPNGLILGLLCGSGFFFVGYLRFFWREKFAKGLIADLGVEQSDSNDDSKKDRRESPHE